MPSQFAIEGITGEVRRQRSGAAAVAAIRQLGLGQDARLRADAAKAAFGAAFGFPPRAVQEAAGQRGGARITILETETGFGKTEAGL